MLKALVMEADISKDGEFHSELGAIFQSDSMLAPEDAVDLYIKCRANIIRKLLNILPNIRICIRNGGLIFLEARLNESTMLIGMLGDAALYTRYKR